LPHPGAERNDQPDGERDEQDGEPALQFSRAALYAADAFRDACARSVANRQVVFR
jgi:hypothetical protein